MQSCSFIPLAPSKNITLSPGSYFSSGNSTLGNTSLSFTPYAISNGMNYRFGVKVSLGSSLAYSSGFVTSLSRLDSFDLRNTTTPVNVVITADPLNSGTLDLESADPMVPIHGNIWRG